MDKTASIPYQSSPYSLDQIQKLVRIAMKAHGFNASPVDIKEELDLLDPENLMLMDEQLTKLLASHKTVKP